MKSFFCPESIAVVGATPNKIKGGYHIYNNLATYYTKGAVYPVNPNYDGYRREERSTKRSRPSRTA